MKDLVVSLSVYSSRIHLLIKHSGERRNLSCAVLFGIRVKLGGWGVFNFKDRLTAHFPGLVKKANGSPHTTCLNTSKP